MSLAFVNRCFIRKTAFALLCVFALLAMVGLFSGEAEAIVYRHSSGFLYSNNDGGNNFYNGIEVPTNAVVIPSATPTSYEIPNSFDATSISGITINISAANIERIIVKTPGEKELTLPTNLAANYFRGIEVEEIYSSSSLTIRGSGNLEMQHIFSPGAVTLASGNYNVNGKLFAGSMYKAGNAVQAARLTVENGVTLTAEGYNGGEGNGIKINGGGGATVSMLVDGEVEATGGGPNASQGNGILAARLTVAGTAKGTGHSAENGEGNGIKVTGTSAANGASGGLGSVETETNYAFVINSSSVTASSNGGGEGNAIYVSGAGGDMLVNRNLGTAASPITGFSGGEGNGIKVGDVLYITGGSVHAKGGDSTTKANGGNGVYAGHIGANGNLTGTGGKPGADHNFMNSCNGVYSGGILAVGVGNRSTVTGTGGDETGGNFSGNGICARGRTIAGNPGSEGTLIGTGGNKTSGGTNGNGVYIGRLDLGQDAQRYGTITGDGGINTDGTINGNGVVIGGIEPGTNILTNKLEITGYGGGHSNNDSTPPEHTGHSNASSGNGVYFSGTGRTGLEGKAAVTGHGAPSCAGSYSGNGVYFGGIVALSLNGDISPTLVGFANQDSAALSAGAATATFSGNGILLSQGLTTSGDVSDDQISIIEGTGSTGTIPADNSGNGVLANGEITLGGGAKIQAKAVGDGRASHADPVSPNSAGRRANGLAVLNGGVSLSDGSMIDATGDGGGTGSTARDSGNGIFTTNQITLTAGSSGTVRSQIIAKGGANHGGINSGNGITARSLISEDDWERQNRIQATGGDNSSGATAGCGVVATNPTTTTASVDVFIGGDSSFRGGTIAAGENAPAIVTSNSRLTNEGWADWNRSNSISNITAARQGPDSVNVTVVFHADIGDHVRAATYPYTAYAALNKEWNKGGGSGIINAAMATPSNAPGATIPKSGHDADSDDGDLSSSGPLGSDAVEKTVSPIIEYGQLRMRTKGRPNVTPSPENYFIEIIRLHYGTAIQDPPSMAMDTTAEKGRFDPYTYGIALPPPRGSSGSYIVDLRGKTDSNGEPIRSIIIDPFQFWCEGDVRSTKRSYTVTHLTGNSAAPYTYSPTVPLMAFALERPQEIFQITVTDAAADNPVSAPERSYIIQFDTDRGTTKPRGMDLTWELYPSNDEAKLTAVTNYTGNGAENLWYYWYKLDGNMRPLSENPFEKGQGLMNVDVPLAAGESYNFRVEISETDGGPLIQDGQQDVRDVKAGGAPPDDNLSARIISTSRTSATTGTLFADAKGYERLQWHRSETSGFTPSQDTELWGQSNVMINDTGLTADTPYYYKIVASRGDQTVTSLQATLAATAPPTTPPTGELTIGGGRASIRFTLAEGQSASSAATETYTASGTGATTPFEWSVINRGENVGADVADFKNITSGALSIGALPKGTYKFTVMATDSSTPKKTGRMDVTITVAGVNDPPDTNPRITITAANVDNKPVTQPSTVNLTASGGQGPYRNWSVTGNGALEGKVSVASTGDNTANVTITPGAGGIAVGTHSFSATVTDANGLAPEQPQTIYVGFGGPATGPDGPGTSALRITEPSNTKGLPTNARSTLTYTASGGRSPYRWALSNQSNALTGKIAVNETSGVVTVESGVAPGTHTFDLTVTDSTTPTALTYRQNFSIEVGNVSPSPTPSASSKLSPDSITITGLPANNTMYVGDKMTLVPSLASGLTRSTSKWEYDTAYFTLSASGETATFTAKKAGTTQILYTVTDTTGATATKTINVTILPRVGLPQTGQDDRLPTAMLWMGAALLMLAPFAERIKNRIRGRGTRNA